MKPNYKLCAKCPHFECRKESDSIKAYCTVKHPMPYIANNPSINVFSGGTNFPSSTFSGQAVSLPNFSASVISGIHVSNPIYYSNSNLKNKIGEVFKPTVKYTNDKFVPEKTFFVPNECPLHLEHTIS